MPKYEVKRDGTILRGKEEIGTIDLATGEMKITDRIAKLHDVAVAHIKSQAFDLMLTQRNESYPPAPPMPPGQVTATIPPPDEFASFQPPPAPPMDPKLGDKTPDYMAWFQTFYPDDFAKKYKGRRTHLTTGRNPHMEGGDIPDNHFGYESEAEWK